ncbi:DUF2970 domain-containing protein [Photobacterium lipolyticum]|uniref:DUF2970 domain-containing protein n=1 Tax=Photobacterium lipolyticum TaxID=266810 RepID=A0A2T3MXZ0_9GAMM|nr:DUF2970 domain-containing protein [Photobacterium lipolyticum]PSW04859.1 hypothetical protein C9I89_11155 [Photobacterium lipolyticum]
MPEQDENSQPQKRKTKRRVALSVAAALFGVQSDNNRQQDFNQRSPWPFIIGGVIAIVVFVALLITVTLLVTAIH